MRLYSLASSLETFRGFSSWKPFSCVFPSKLYTNEKLCHVLAMFVHINMYEYLIMALRRCINKKTHNYIISSQKSREKK